eukprot:14213289-Alexandrium_andersonii.AAC.1
MRPTCPPDSRVRCLACAACLHTRPPCTSSPLGYRAQACLPSFGALRHAVTRVSSPACSGAVCALPA